MLNLSTRKWYIILCHEKKLNETLAELGMQSSGVSIGTFFCLKELP